MVRTKDGVAANASGSEFLASWTADGRRKPDLKWNTITPANPYPQLAVAATPLADGGFAVATAGHVARINAVGSTTCPGCGPPPPSCDDAESCTADACDAILGDCTHVKIVGCKKSLGTCIADADCDDGEPCTGDVCAKATGACSHVGLTTCHLGNVCAGWLGGNPGSTPDGTCVAGKCTPPAYIKQGLPPTQGWVARTHCTRPQFFEAKAGELLVAGCWQAIRFQGDGVVRWRHQLSGQIGAAAVTAEDGLLLIVRQGGTAKPDGTRLVRLSAQGKVLSDSVVTTGLADWHLVDAHRERKRWLVARTGGGFALVGTQAWTADAWQGRVVELSAQGTVTSAMDVMLAGLGGAAPGARGIDQVWAAPDGGLYLGWHRLVQGKQRTWGAARLSASGQVLWSQPLTAAPMIVGGFDPWRPRGAAVSTKDGVPGSNPGSIAKVALLPTGPTPAILGDTASLGHIPSLPPYFGDVLAFAELPGERTVAAADTFGEGTLQTDALADFGQSATWPPVAAKGQFTAVEILKKWQMLALHSILDVFVLSDKRVVLSVGHGHGRYLYPAIIVLDGNGRFRPCGWHPEAENCPTWPVLPCKSEW